MNNNNIICKFCLSKNTKKHGSYKGKQRYFCNDCKHSFNADNQLYNMKTPDNQVSSALDMYYKGMSINSIRDNLNEQYQNCPSSKTIYGWIQKYTNLAINQFKDYHPETGNTFIADETMLKIEGKNVWMYDIIDSDTRFLLATQIATSRAIHQAQTLMELASKKANKIPRTVITDSNNSYPEGIELAYGSESTHIQSEPFAESNDTQKIERFHSTLKERTKVMRGLKSIESAKKFVEGWLIYYNYLRPHESLNGKTPAEEAKIKYPSKSWVEIIHVATPQTKVLVTPAKIAILDKEPKIVRPKINRHYNMSNKKHLRLIHKIQNQRESHSENIVKEIRS